METPNEIYFYDHHGAYGYLSNFHPANFTTPEGAKFNCTEQYLMFNKCKLFSPDNKTLLANIMAETDPGKVKRMGRQVLNYDDDEWDAVRYDIMLEGLRMKFAQNPVMAEALKATKPKVLYEASPTDRIWGIGFSVVDAPTKNKTQFGENLLGKALMAVRDSL